MNGKRRYSLIIINLLLLSPPSALRHFGAELFLSVHLSVWRHWIIFGFRINMGASVRSLRKFHPRAKRNPWNDDRLLTKLYQKEFTISIRCPPWAPRTKFTSNEWNFTLHQYDLISIWNFEEVKFIALCWKFCCFVFVRNGVGSDWIIRSGSSAKTNLCPRKSI